MRKNDILNHGKEVLKIEAEAILQLAEHLNANFVTAIEMLYNCKGRAIIIGMGKPGIIAKKISATLASTGTPRF